jgi:tRNA-specific 2-thiouridylase
VAAALLARDRHDVVGVTMRLIPEGDAAGESRGSAAVRDARRVCDLLDIPHQVFDMRDVFTREVVEPFTGAYAAGRTPNPCVDCNDRVKFAALWRRVALHGAEFLATGHYARIVRDPDGHPWLARGTDAAKDQSYFLYRMTAEQLDRTIFPVGDLLKAEVRAIASELGLPTAAKRESQDVCFVSTSGHAALVAAAHPASAVPGPIVDTRGCSLGTHRGIAAYTVGQRRHLGVSAPEPLYVVAVRADDNTVVVGGRADTLVRELVCGHAIWRGGPHARVEVRVRYRGRPALASAEMSTDRLVLTFDEPVEGVAAGQAAVCYKGEAVVGGGTVTEAR